MLNQAYIAILPYEYIVSLIQKLVSLNIRVQLKLLTYKEIVMNKDSHLYILWTTDNPTTAKEMISLYGGNCLKKGWWEEVTIIIWGASAQLVSSNAIIQQEVTDLLALGVHISACKRCTDDLGVTSQLESLGIETKYWGEPLTEILKSGAVLITI